MLTNISWSNYIIAIIVLLLSWYLYLGFRFYKSEFKYVLSGKQKIRFPTANNNGTKLNLKERRQEDTFESNLSSSFEESSSTLEDADELSRRLLAAVSEHSQAGMSKEEFTNYVRLILNEYPFVKNSSLRTMISNLLVLESEKYPQIVLTHTEADSLWNEMNE